MVAAGGGSVPITINAPQVREYETGTTGTTRLFGSYTKQDARVAKLRIRTILNNNVVGETFIDVSSLAVGQSGTINVQLQNGLQKVSVTADNMQSDTVPADGSKTFTAPGDHLLVIVDIDGALSVEGWPTDWPANIVVFPGASVTLINQDQADHNVEIYSIPVDQLPSPAQVGIEIAELDAANNELYTASATIDDIPPLEISMAGEAGQVQITAIA